MINLQQPHTPTQLENALILLGFAQKQWIRWAEIGLSHQRLAMIAAQEKVSSMAQSKDPFRAQLTALQMLSEQFSNHVQMVRNLWASQFETQSQWNQTWLHLVQAQQHGVTDLLQFQWMAAQPPADYANALAESVMAMSRHFVNGADTRPRSQP
jgi:hypothetical protein